MSAPNATGLRRVVAASMAGTVVEWYEFFLYGTAATLVFNKLFFPQGGNDLDAIMAAFGTYAIGFLARPLGGIVPMHKIDNLTIDFETFRKEGFMLGHASILCIPEDFRMTDYLQHLFEFTAVESCGKCYPCRIGSRRGEELIHGAREKDQKIDRQLFNDLLETMEIGSLCALGGGLPLGINNALQYFGDELKANFKS